MQPEEYNGPSGGFAEMVAVEQKVRGEDTLKSMQHLKEMGELADSKTNIGKTPEDRHEVRNLELDAMINGLQGLKDLLGKYPELGNFVSIHMPNYSDSSGNRVSDPQKRYISRQ